MSERAHETFSKTLRNLEQSQQYQPPYDPVIEAGIVMLFHLCMEQSWKAMRVALVDQGFSMTSIASPRSIVKCAYSAGMIDDEKGWLNALEARNLVTHSYDESVALKLIGLTRTRFIPLFQQLEARLQSDWAL